MHFIFVVKRDSDLRRFRSYPHLVITETEKTGFLKIQKVIARWDSFEAEASELICRRPLYDDFHEQGHFHAADRLGRLVFDNSRNRWSSLSRF
jgi:hypothetical protein